MVSLAYDENNHCSQNLTQTNFHTILKNNRDYF